MRSKFYIYSRFLQHLLGYNCETFYTSPLAIFSCSVPRKKLIRGGNVGAPFRIFDLFIFHVRSPFVFFFLSDFSIEFSCSFCIIIFDYSREIGWRLFDKKVKVRDLGKKYRKLEIIYNEVKIKRILVVEFSPSDGEEKDIWK